MNWTTRVGAVAMFSQTSGSRRIRLRSGARPALPALARFVSSRGVSGLQAHGPGSALDLPVLTGLEDEPDSWALEVSALAEATVSVPALSAVLLPGITLNAEPGASLNLPQVFAVWRARLENVRFAGASTRQSYPGGSSEPARINGIPGRRYSVQARPTTLSIWREVAVVQLTEAWEQLPPFNLMPEEREFRAIEVETHDSDADGLLDAWERQYFPDLSQGPSGDPDGDGLTNAQEQIATTNPTAADTDGDTFSDGAELLAGSNPLDPNSRPAAAPQITAQPQGRTVADGGSVTFNVTATGTAPLAYQWRKGNQPIENATGSSLTLNPVRAADAGSYSVVVSNAAGSVPSDPAVLTVTPVVTDCPPAQLTAVLVPGLWVEGQVGCRFRIEFSPTLTDPVWQPLDTFTLTQPRELWVDVQSVGQPVRFYRAVRAE